MDAGRANRRFPGYTTKELIERLVTVEDENIRDQMLAEIERRETDQAPIMCAPQVTLSR